MPDLDVECDRARSRLVNARGDLAAYRLPVCLAARRLMALALLTSEVVAVRQATDLTDLSAGGYPEGMGL
jgi:hypothetical protein